PTSRLLDSYEGGDWITLIFEDIEGAAPRTPWRQAELDRVLRAVEELSASLTPAPIAVEPVSELMPMVFAGWRRLAAGVESGQDDMRGIDPWAQRHLAELVALEALAPDAASAGTTLLHADLRADNILLTPSRVFFIDWPWASRGAAWVDLAFMLPSVAMQGGPKPWEIFDAHPLGYRAPDAHVTAVVAAVAGFMIFGSRLPPPPGLPTVRAFQRDQGLPALEWLKRRAGRSSRAATPVASNASSPWRTANATPSSAARKRWPREWLRRRPIQPPLASGSKYGVRSPVRYGRKTRPSAPAGTANASV